MKASYQEPLPRADHPEQFPQLLCDKEDIRSSNYLLFCSTYLEEELGFQTLCSPITLTTEQQLGQSLTWERQALIQKVSKEQAAAYLYQEVLKAEPQVLAQQWTVSFIFVTALLWLPYSLTINKQKRLFKSICFPQKYFKLLLMLLKLHRSLYLNYRNDH